MIGALLVGAMFRLNALMLLSEVPTLLAMVVVRMGIIKKIALFLTFLLRNVEIAVL